MGMRMREGPRVGTLKMAVNGDSEGSASVADTELALVQYRMPLIPFVRKQF